MSPGSEVLASRDGALLILTLNRPHRLNAVNATLYQRLAREMERARDDSRVRCVVLTGAGRAFCSGSAPTAFSRRFPSPSSLR